MKIIINKNTVLSTILGVAVALIAYRITPVHVDPVIKLVISKNKTPISEIHQVRDIDITKEVMVDEINLADKSRFRHAKLGEIGYASDFFVDINHEIKVKQAGEYRFNIGSDDGFTASIDGKLLCEFRRDRPFIMESCLVKLSEGSHQFSLSYFQGGGNAGLSAEYMKTGESKMRFFGDSSKFIEF